ncbi:hypothetical protein O5542_29570, partial [Escherichia coli]|nr:hypothetical protein [Escherichia coli]
FKFLMLYLPFLLNYENIRNTRCTHKGASEGQPKRTPQFRQRRAENEAKPVAADVIPSRRSCH